MTSVAAALELYGQGLTQRRPRLGSARVVPVERLHARTQDGTIIPLPLRRWLRDPSRAEHRLLRDLHGPVLDVGCGPGRHAAALHARGVPVLGLDVSQAAVRLARKRGAPALRGSIFDHLPLTGRWGSALLLDGNVGIGGDPVVLLTRIAELLRPGGIALIEMEGPGEAGRVFQVRLEGAGLVSDWFPWARVGIDGIDVLACSCGFDVARIETARDRWFARLMRALPT